MTVERRAKVTPMSKADREKTINEIIQSKNPDHTPIVVANGKEYYVPVIQVPLHLPLYRIDSSRTHDSQQLKISQGIYDEGIFDLSKESTQQAQQAQHDILCDMAEDNERNLFELFDKQIPARDKFFIITKDGVLVNGNCRTATLREMTARGEGKPEFNHIYVAVIKDPVTRTEMTDIEMSLQLKDRWQSDYDWIQLTTKALLQVKAGIPEDEVKNYWTQFDLKGRLQADYDTLMLMRAELDSYLELKGISREIERIRKVTGYRQLIKTFVEGTKAKTWTQDKKEEGRQFLYLQLNNAINGQSIEGERGYQSLRNQLDEIIKHGGSTINDVLEEQGLTSEPTKSDSLSKFGTEKKKTVSLKKIAGLSEEASKQAVIKQRKINQDKKNERKDRADKRGVQRAVELAENNLGNALGFLSRKDIQYNNEGVIDRLKEIREILNEIEILLK